jgi:hypothetical protein
MAHDTTWRARAALLTATTLAALMFAAACGSAGNGNGQPTGGTGQLGGTPSGQATTPGTQPSGDQTTGGQNQTGNPGTTTTQAPLYPTNAKDYATAMLTAYGNSDHDRLVVLAASNVPDYLAGQPQLVGPWTFLACSNDATQNCYFYNSAGKGIMVGVVKTQLGHPQAVIYATQANVEIPGDPVSYLNAFDSAWGSNDYYGMMALTTSAALNFFHGRQPGTGGLTYTAGATTNGKQLFTIMTQGGSYFCEWTVLIDVNLASQHKLHAISTAKLPTPCVTA